MEVLIAPDGFKGTIAAVDAARAIGDGWRSRRPDDRVVLLPMADGGEGTVDAIAAASPGAERRALDVTGPSGAPVRAAWLRVPRADGTVTAVVELAAASGIEHFASVDDLRPLDAHTVGLGELVADALLADVDDLLLTLGSSASTDGGTGMLRALGARFLDDDGRDVPLGARGLPAVRAVDMRGIPPLPPGGIAAMVDVDAPLTGVLGAAAVYGPQKGLTGAPAAVVDAALGALADLLGVDPAVPGLGAAGGTALAVVALGGRLRPGADAVAEVVGLADALRTADLVVTGEGHYDAQSERGKAPSAVRVAAARAGVPAVLVAGGIGADPFAAGYVDAVSLTETAGSSERARRDPGRWLAAAGAALADRR